MEEDIVLSWSRPWTDHDREVHLSPLPPALNQGQRDLCIPYALHTVLSSQANIVALRNWRNPPGRFSLDQLVSMLYDLPRAERTIENMLRLIHRDGIVEEDRFNRNTRRVRRWSRRYYVDYNYGFDPRTNPEDVFNRDVEHELEMYPLIAEMTIGETYQQQNDVLYHPPHLPRRYTRPPLGHAICLTGWGTSTVDHETPVWEYLNSYGAEFGRDGGYGEVVKTGLHYVYGASIREWWDL